MNQIFKAGAIVAAVVLTGAAAATASVPDAGGVIRGCYDKSSGAVRVIDTAKTTTCKSSEKALSWEQRGPQANQGPAGPAGAGVAPETRVGHCVAGFKAGSPAGTTVSRTCAFAKPFSGECFWPEVTATPAQLGGLETEDSNAILGYPGVDYTYWVNLLSGDGDCDPGNMTGFALTVRLLRAAPAAKDLAMGFSFSAGIRTMP
jgi:hypothetical protein